jgi:two-component system nitrogen regulation sensor histidine kinase NtrY
MSARSLLFPIALLLGLAAVVGLLSRELSRAWFLPGLQTELQRELQQSLADQRELARLLPDTTRERRQRFERTQELQKHLRVLALSRESLIRRHAGLLLGGAIVVGLAAGGLHVLRQSRRNRRLERLQGALRELAYGALDVRVSDSGRDVIGRVARMVEDVSTVSSRERRRLSSLEDLSRWQEAARRHAHEMRTPLSAAELDLARLREVVDAQVDATLRPRIAADVERLSADIRRLAEFARAFAAFGRLPAPRPTEQDLVPLVREFTERFARAWPRLHLEVEAPAGPVPAAVDVELLRQVLVNLCENSNSALAEAGRDNGTVGLTVAAAAGQATLNVADDGPGIPPQARERLFQPYATFRRGGTGLGLAISRKILLDHGGEMELVPTTSGTVFRLTLPQRIPRP